MSPDNTDTDSGSLAHANFHVFVTERGPAILAVSQSPWRESGLGCQLILHSPTLQTRTSAVAA